MVNNITIISASKCCGCRACADVCTSHAILFTLNGEGFYHPSVNENLCIQCGRCVTVCPVSNATFSIRPELCFASFANMNSDKLAGSSGGVFGVLAREAIKQGYMVFGAAFDNKLKLKHKMVSNIDDLRLIQKSKYIQSNTEGVYKEIWLRLRQGEKVVFCGTPCQCAALRNYIGEKRDNLLLVDFVCHGVPSQDLFDKTISWYEKKNKCKVREFQFRYKGERVKHPQSYRIVAESKSGKVIETIGLHYQFPYYFAFQIYISLRMSCYECSFARPERCSDITLGDFWGIEKRDLNLKANDGVSLIVSNTVKGQKWVELLNAKGLMSSYAVPYNFAIENNGCLSKPTMMPKTRTQFYSDLQQLDFNEVMKKHMKSKKQYVFDLYYALPSPLRKFVRKIMDKRMKYE